MCKDRQAMARVQILQHVPFEGPANLDPWLRARGASLATARLWLGEPPPAPEAFDALVVLGGPMNADDEARFPWLADEKRAIERAIAAGRRVLGVCLGAQLVARVLGAKVTRNREVEIGWFPVERSPGAEASPVGRALPARAEVFHWHGDTFGLPDGALRLASSAACDEQAFVWEERVLALQFHLETSREAARALVEHCGDELVPGRFVQPREEILAGDARFARLEALLGRVLDAFFGAQHG
jgi:GMP synthase-like glutamine amidotransferase